MPFIDDYDFTAEKVTIALNTKDEIRKTPNIGLKMNSNALTTGKLHAENAKRVSGEFYC
jgi:hypothetical protein